MEGRKGESKSIPQRSQLGTTKFLCSPQTFRGRGSLQKYLRAFERTNGRIPKAGGKDNLESKERGQPFTTGNKKRRKSQKQGEVERKGGKRLLGLLKVVPSSFRETRNTLI